jgi:hypothetical protein
LAVQIRCLRCGGGHFIWQCEVPAPDIMSDAPDASGTDPGLRTGKFDKVAYQREYMRARRKAAKERRHAKGHAV